VEVDSSAAFRERECRVVETTEPHRNGLARPAVLALARAAGYYEVQDAVLIDITGRDVDRVRCPRRDRRVGPGREAARAVAEQDAHVAVALVDYRHVHLSVAIEVADGDRVRCRADARGSQRRQAEARARVGMGRGR
jgi:hypothetical protein